MAGKRGIALAAHGRKRDNLVGSCAKTRPQVVEVKAVTQLAIVCDIALALNRKFAGLLLASLPALEEGEAHA